MSPLLPSQNSDSPQAPAGAAVLPAEAGVMDRLESFFFAEERPVGLALVRILLCLVMLIPTLHRVFRVREFYSLDGWPTPLWNSYGQFDFLPTPTAPVAAGLYALLIMAQVSAGLGWRTRLSLLIAGVLTAYFGLLDQISTMTKYTVIAVHVFLLLSISDCGRTWSIDRWLARRRGLDWPETGPAWPRRLIQILLGVVYLGAAATKLHTQLFFSGDQLRFWLLSDDHGTSALGQALSQQPALILVMAYVTVVWEITFLFTAWKGIGRTVMLSLGCVFHVMTYFTLGLLIFPLLSLAIYAAWYEARDHVGFLARWDHWFGRDFREDLSTAKPTSPAGVPWNWNWTSFQNWCIYAGCAVALGVWMDHTSDPFGENQAKDQDHPNGRYVLQPIDKERLALLMQDDETLDVGDKVFSLTIGSVLFNDNLVNQKKTFRYGERANVQCSLLPPHEDLFMEVQLRNEGEQIVRREHGLVLREHLRAHFWFDMDESIPAGNYSIVVRFHGKDAGRRSLVLLPDTPIASRESDQSSPSEEESLPVATASPRER